jgi:predicted RNA binding protein YcfA (HicA-like mRNA interferase family)
MAKLPVCSGADAIQAFERAGWLRKSQKGSHVTLIKSGALVVLTVPLHRELGPGLLRSLIRKAGLTVEEFVEQLNA